MMGRIVIIGSLWLVLSAVGHPAVGQPNTETVFQPPRPAVATETPTPARVATSPTPALDARTLELARRWLAAVSTRDATAAIGYAEAIAGSTDNVEVPAVVTELLDDAGVSQAFLAMPFNELDYERWQRALALKRIADERGARKKGRLLALAEAVTNDVTTTESAPPAWPLEVWRRGYGTPREKAWLLAELCYQRHYEPQVVELLDTARSESLHFCCEVRRGTDLVYVVDPTFKSLGMRESLEKMVYERYLLPKTWPERPDLWKAAHSPLFWTAGYPQDYCPRNQRLYRVVSAVLGDACPRFGESPMRRLARYRTLRKASLPVEPKFSMGLWPYPFHVLQRDLAQRVAK